MKEQGRNSQGQISEEEISSLPEREFRIRIVKMLQRLENGMEKMQDTINTVNTITKDIEKIKNKQIEMNNTISETKNTPEGSTSRITEAEEWISELEDRMVEITAEEQNKGKRIKRIEDSRRDLWENIKCTNIWVIGVPEEEEEEKKGPENIFEEIIVHPKGDQSWVFIGRTDVEAETPILWPPDAKSWLIWKDPDAGKDWGPEEKGKTEDEMVGWHHRLDEHGFGWTPGVGDGQGGLVCCGSWGHKESDTTERLNWTELIVENFPTMEKKIVKSNKCRESLIG